MGSNPESNPSRPSPNGISIREFIEALLTERDRRYEERFLSQDRLIMSKLEAIARATELLATQFREFKIDNNEWRGQSKDQTAQFQTRVDSDTHFKAVEKEIAGLRESRSTTEGAGAGRSEARAEVRYAIGLALALGGALAGYFLK